MCVLCACSCVPYSLLLPLLSSQDAMDALSNQEGVHYAYVLVKPGGALDSDTAPHPDLP